ncbi:Serine/threonine-protein kinase Sgk3 [Polyplax serrata]|uniref:Serine/threonine-protein kinase Sgk3 n=1 Tax=Polyplax serrata TaxID=468196 RepID=A0ABR1BC15_POLSC
MENTQIGKWMKEIRSGDNICGCIDNTVLSSTSKQFNSEKLGIGEGEIESNSNKNEKDPELQVVHDTNEVVDVKNTSLESRTVRVKSILKKPSVGVGKPDEFHNNNSNPCLSTLTTKSLDNTTLITSSKIKVEVCMLVCDIKNNNGEFGQPTCWYKFLSTLCSWRMSSDVLEKVQTARVQDSETWDIEKRSKYTVYKVVVHSGTSSWFVFRRYTEFHKLFESLKKQFPNLQLKLPGKKLFGNNLDPNFVATRQDGLDNFVQNIISQSALLQLPEVREFFKLDNKYQAINDGITKNENIGQEVKPENKLNLGPSERSHAQPSDFDFLRVIGQGSFGKVLLAKHKAENKYYAVKVLKKKQVIRKNEAKHIMSERNVLLKTLNHPFLVGLHYSFQTTEKLYFVLDYVNGGELFFHLQKETIFSESRSQFYAAEMACALGYLHSKGIIYRDLKPENILLDAQGHIVLTDFGLSKEGLLGTDTTKTFCGTPEYLAPEIILKEAYDRSVDWWCLGTVLYEMLFGLPPFYCQDTSEMYDRILNKPLVIKTSVSESARDILSKLLEKDRSKRLGSGYGDFDDVQRHQFFRHINWDNLIAKKIKPPFNPLVKGVMDLRNIDPQFTKEQVPASIEQNTDDYLSASVREADDVFAGFSYAPPTAELSA